MTTNDALCAALAQAAAEYAHLGYAVLPLHHATETSCSCGRPKCRSQGKHPIYADWGASAVTSPDTAAAMWASRPHANVGIATGILSGFWVLDIDPDNGGFESLARLESDIGSLPRTRTHGTGSGGVHYLWRMPPASITNRRGRLRDYPGIDVRGTGGLIVAPPSVSAKGGYRVIFDDPIIDPPPALVDMIVAEPAREPLTARVAGIAHLAAGARREEFETRAGALAALTSPGSGRSQMINDLGLWAGHGVPVHWSENEATALIEGAIETSGYADEHGWPEARRQLTNGLTAGMADPWLAPAPTGELLTWEQVGGAPVELAPTRDLEAETGAEVEAARASQTTAHLRIAELYGVRFEQHLRNVNRIGWHWWSGSHWEPDDRARGIEAYSVWARERLALADHLRTAEATADIGDAVERQVRGACTYSAIAGVLSLAGALPPLSVAPSQMDADPELVATPDGTIDLRTGEMRPADRGDLLTRCLTAGPKPWVGGAWDRFLHQVLPDAEVRDFVQRLFGSALVGRQDEQVLPIFHGAGANGKGVIADVVSALLGSYACAIQAEDLMSTTHVRHASWMMPLRGARVAFASETDKDRKINSSLVKRLTGGDRITANAMRQESVTWSPTHQLILLTNHSPQVECDDDAMWRRLIIVPFDVVVPEQDRDPLLGQKLRADLGAVAGWMLDGYREYRRIGLAVPETVRARTAKQRVEGDALTRWLEDEVVRTPNEKLRAAETYGAWVSWCARNGETHGSSKLFGMALSARGLRSGRDSAGNYWAGIQLKCGVGTSSQLGAPEVLDMTGKPLPQAVIR